MKRNVAKIVSLVLILMGGLQGICYADSISPFEEEPSKPIAKPRLVLYAPTTFVIIGIIVAIVVVISILLLVSFNKNEKENTEEKSKEGENQWKSF